MDSPLRFEFTLAHSVLRHDCVRLRAVISSEAYVILLGAIFAQQAHCSTGEGRVVALAWCIAALLISSGSIASILLARRTRRFIIARVNYLRQQMMGDEAISDAYRRIAGFPREVLPVSRLFLLPQLLGCIAFALVAVICIVWLCAGQNTP